MQAVTVVIGGRTLRGYYNPETHMFHGPRCTSYHRKDIEKVIDGEIDD